ncbi:MAG: UDP-N-acetylmuramoyl-tripeptide--D-alanyl-D-alanine ligase [Candidatus Omnitrophica bacterium]|nr:UDP-N-acetylmuramoyl-tripeptide--D-alanyl-D-alanine ligase [Candidatus Omnitrophota bacterium]
MFRVDELLKATAGKLVSGNKNSTIKGISIDSRNIKKGDAFLAIRGENFDGHEFIPQAIKKGASCVIKEASKCQTCLPVGRSVKLSKLAVIEVKDTTNALGDIARFNRRKFNIPVIAVSGSNGKTTTKELIAWILSKKFKVLKNEGTKNNHIGLPLTLLKLDNSYDIAVVEIGTNHFGEVGYLADICQPTIAVITNIGSSHLEYFKDLSGVFKEKYTLIKHLQQPGLAILNCDDVFLRQEVLRKTRTPFTLSVGIRSKSDFFTSAIKDTDGEIKFKVNQKFKFTLKALGYYNIYNALEAIAVARVLGMEYRDIAKRIATFNLPKSRLNLIKFKGISFIDDTYNSNPLSLKQALDVLENFKTSGRKILVMGDMLELGSKASDLHLEAIEKALKFCQSLICVGRLSKIAAEACGAKKNIFTCETSFEARKILFKEVCVAKNDIVLVKGSRRMMMEEVFKI